MRKTRIISNNIFYFLLDDSTDKIIGGAIGMVAPSESVGYDHRTYYGNASIPKFDSKEECYKYYFDPTLTCYLVKSKNSYVRADKNLRCTWSLANKVSDDLKKAFIFHRKQEAIDECNDVNQNDEVKADPSKRFEVIEVKNKKIQLILSDVL